MSHNLRLPSEHAGLVSLSAAPIVHQQRAIVLINNNIRPIHHGGGGQAKVTAVTGGGGRPRVLIAGLAFANEINSLHRVAEWRRAGPGALWRLTARAPLPDPAVAPARAG